MAWDSFKKAHTIALHGVVVGLSYSLVAGMFVGVIAVPIVGGWFLYNYFAKDEEQVKGDIPAENVLGEVPIVDDGVGTKVLVESLESY